MPFPLLLAGKRSRLTKTRNSVFGSSRSYHLFQRLEEVAHGGTEYDDDDDGFVLSKDENGTNGIAFGAC